MVDSTMKIKHIIDEGLNVLYEPDFISPEQAQTFLEALTTEADWHRPEMKMWDKTVVTKRQVAWHADAGLVYEYSGQEHEWKDWTPAMHELRMLVEERMERSYNGVLLNMYTDGSEYVSPHADDERDMEEGVPIVAISLGAVRDFVFKHNNGNRYVLPLEAGSLVVMAGDTQKVSKHSIPKRAKVKDPRISLTFRQCVRRIWGRDHGDWWGDSQ